MLPKFCGLVRRSGWAWGTSMRKLCAVNGLSAADDPCGSSKTAERASKEMPETLTPCEVDEIALSLLNDSRIYFQDRIGHQFDVDRARQVLESFEAAIFDAEAKETMENGIAIKELFEKMTQTEGG